MATRITLFYTLAEFEEIITREIKKNPHLNMFFLSHTET